MFPLTKRHLVALNKRIRNPHICYRDYKRLNVKQSFLNMRPLFSKKDVDYPQTCIPTHELLTKPYLGQECKSVGIIQIRICGYKHACWTHRKYDNESFNRGAWNWRTYDKYVECARPLPSYQACLFPTQSVVTTPVFSKFVSRLRTVEIFDKIRFNHDWWILGQLAAILTEIYFT